MNFFPVWCVLSSCDGLCIMHFDNSAKYSLHCNSIRVDCSRQGPPKIEPNLKIKTRQSYSIHLFWHFFCVFLFFLSFPLSIFLISSYQPSVSPFHKIFIQMFLDWWSFEIERIGEEKRKSAGRVHFDCGAMTNYLQQAGRKQHGEWGEGRETEFRISTILLQLFGAKFEYFCKRIFRGPWKYANLAASMANVKLMRSIGTQLFSTKER